MTREPTAAKLEYDAFISYSHGSDEEFAPAFQEALERFARVKRRARSVRVFRDNANLAANPDLWSSIETALASSEWLVLLASPEAAASKWVGKEIEWWLRHRSTDRILFGLTNGKLHWDPKARSGIGDFSTSSESAHPALLGRLPGEPSVIDLRKLPLSTPKKRQLKKLHTTWLDDDDPNVQSAIADFASPLRGVPKDELVGAHVK